jgi:hypothetical protein
MPAADQASMAESMLALGWYALSGQALLRGALGPGVEEAESEAALVHGQGRYSSNVTE